jgi:hypothetical protein
MHHGEPGHRAHVAVRASPRRRIAELGALDRCTRMNKPLTFVCSFIALPGLLILGCAIYFCILYGHGDLEAGNFHRCTYSVERDAATGRIYRSYDTSWDLVSSTEGSPLAQFLSMWAVGIGLPLVGAGLYAADSGSRQRPCVS